MTAFAFTADALLPEVVQLKDGSLAVRQWHSRKRVWGWMVLSTNGARERFLTDKQLARE
jgi:hypothetical protein